MILTGDSGDGELNITLRTPGGASLVIINTEIVISNGQGAPVSLSGSTVNINNGALTVT